MNVQMLDLWMPIAASAVVVFFASFVAHMVLKHHKTDYGRLPNEDAVLGVMRSGSVGRGQYMFPHCSDYSQMKDPELKRKFEAGPMGTITVWPGGVNMGGNLIKTFILYLVIAAFVAYLASLALARGGEFTAVFRFTATAAVMAHCLGFCGHSIWKQQPGRAFLNDMVDGIAYGLLTGVVFGLLWPGLSA